MNKLFTLILIFALSLSLAFADSADSDASLPADGSMPTTIIESEPGLTTIWAVGDVDVIARAFSAVAMFFNHGIMMSLFILASLIALLVQLVQIITRKDIQLTNYFIMLIIASVLFVPKTSVWVSSYYDSKGGLNGGAVGFKKVDGIPIGIALPLGLFSKIAKSFTSTYDEGMQTLSDTNITGGLPIAEGGMMLHGAEGYFSPLKAVLKLRNQVALPSDSNFLTNLARTSRDCFWHNHLKDMQNGGIFNLIIHGQESHITEYNLPGSNKKNHFATLSCNNAGKLLALAMLENVVDIPGKNYSQTAVNVDQAKSFALATGKNTDQNNTYQSTQTELDQLPNAIANAAGGDTSRSLGIFGVQDIQSLIDAVISQTQTFNDTPNALAQIFTAKSAVNAAEFEANMIFSRVIQACAVSPESCVQQAYMMTEAKDRAAIDATGEAGMFQTFMGYTMNVLLFIYIVVAPMIIFLVLTMGWAGWKIISSYLLFAAWINSWLPLMNAIAYYMLQNYTNAMHRFVVSMTASDDPHRVYSPFVINNIIDSTRDMLASASTMMSAVPLIMLSLFSGSIYGLVQLAQRASMTNKDFVDEDKVSPKLDQSQVIGMGRILTNSSAGGPPSADNLDQKILTDAQANNPGLIKLSEYDGQSKDFQQEFVYQNKLENLFSNEHLEAVFNSKGVAIKSGKFATEDSNKNFVFYFAEKGEVGNNIIQQHNFNGGIGGSCLISTKAGSEVSQGENNLHSVNATFDVQGNDMRGVKIISAANESSLTFDEKTELKKAYIHQKAQTRINIDNMKQSINHMDQVGTEMIISHGGFAAFFTHKNKNASSVMIEAAMNSTKYDQFASDKLFQASNNIGDYFTVLKSLMLGSDTEKQVALSAIANITSKTSPDTSILANKLLHLNDESRKMINKVKSSANRPLLSNVDYEGGKQQLEKDFQQKLIKNNSEIDLIQNDIQNENIDLLYNNENFLKDVKKEINKIPLLKIDLKQLLQDGNKKD